MFNLLFCSFWVELRSFLYYWDYVCYYRIQLGVAGNFRSDGFLTPILNVIGSVWYEDYSTFNNIFLAAPFALTPQSANWFVACSAFVILPMLYWAIAILIKQLERLLKPLHHSFFFAGGMAICAGFPLLHRSLLYGQPDLFGLVFVFRIFEHVSYALAVQSDGTIEVNDFLRTP